jgi:hypothetical protein
MIDFLLRQPAWLLALVFASLGLFLAIWLMKLRGRTRERSPRPAPPSPPEGDDFARFEHHVRGAFDGALLDSGHGSIRAWLMLRQAVKDLHLSMEDARVEALGAELGRSHGLFIWAYARHTPDDKGHLERFIARFAPRPWEGLLDSEPQHPRDCYHALPHLDTHGLSSGHAYLVVAKAGVLLAQHINDDVAEGLLWSALAQMMLDHFEVFGFKALRPVDRLFLEGTQVILATPTFDAFQPVLEWLAQLRETLTREERLELEGWMAKFQEAYGADIQQMNGCRISGWEGLVKQGEQP